MKDKFITLVLGAVALSIIATIIWAVFTFTTVTTVFSVIAVIASCYIFGKVVRMFWDDRDLFFGKSRDYS